MLVTSRKNDFLVCALQTKNQICCTYTHHVPYEFTQLLAYFFRDGWHRDEQHLGSSSRGQL